MFCSECGANLKEVDSVTISKPVSAPVSQPSETGLEMPKNTKHDYSVQQNVNTLSEAPKIESAAPATYTPPVYSAPAAPVYAAPVAPVYAVPAPAAPFGGYQDQSSRVIGETKKQCGSPLMFVGAVALTISVFMSILSYFLNFDVWKVIFNEMLELLFNGEDFYSNYELREALANASEPIAYAAGIIMLAASVSLVVGIWLTIAQRFTYSPKIETIGLSCIKAAQRVYISIASCALGFVVICFLKAMVDISEIGESPFYNLDEMRFNTIFLAMIMLAIVILYIVTYAGANGSMSRCESSMKYSGATFYASTFTAVMLLVFSFLSLFAISLGNNYGSAFYQLFGDSVSTAPYVGSLFKIMCSLFTVDGCSVAATIFYVISSISFAIMIFIQRFNMLRINNETRHTYM